MHEPAPRRVWSPTRMAAFLGVAMLILAGISWPAEARVTFGVGIGVPLYGPPGYLGPPPYYYPPPVYVAPPPVWAPPAVVYPPPVIYAPPGFRPQPGTGVPPGFIAPPGYVSPGYGAPSGGGAVSGQQICDAGTYQCPMERPSTPGAGCYCRGNAGERVWGRVQ